MIATQHSFSFFLPKKTGVSEESEAILTPLVSELKVNPFPCQRMFQNEHVP